jgi:hypothetical protein
LNQRLANSCTNARNGLSHSFTTISAKSEVEIELRTLARPLARRSPSADHSVATLEYPSHHGKESRQNLIDSCVCTVAYSCQNLDNPSIFEPQNLAQIRNLIEQHVSIHAWSPLKSFRRIIVSFYDIDSAKIIKQTVDNEVIFDCRVRVYFGAQTEISPTQQHLKAPDAGRLFFISPPPSPPHGWEMRNEDPPNKMVHADDLAVALAKLHARPINPMSPAMDDDAVMSGTTRKNRSRSATLVYHPEDYGSNPTLPAISVEDTSETEEIPSPEQASPMEGVQRSAPILHTSRPPVELMEH